MAEQCARCGATIEAAAVRYVERVGDDTTTYCSVNCIAGVDHVDEDDARDRLFADRVEQ